MPSCRSPGVTSFHPNGLLSPPRVCGRGGGECQISQLPPAILSEGLIVPQTCRTLEAVSKSIPRGSPPIASGSARLTREVGGVGGGAVRCAECGGIWVGALISLLHSPIPRGSSFSGTPPQGRCERHVSRCEGGLSGRTKRLPTLSPPPLGPAWGQLQGAGWVSRSRWARALVT